MVAASASTLELRAERLRESLKWSASITTEACGVLDQYQLRLADLERQIQPIAVRTQQLTQARERIKSAREEAEEVLDHLDTARKVEARIDAGPRQDIDAFLKALERLEGAITYLSEHRSMAAADASLKSATQLRDVGQKRIQEDFVSTLRDNAPVPSAQALTGQAFADSPGARTPSSAGRSGEADKELELVPLAVLPRLKRLAAAALRNGDTVCFKAYCELRRSVLERALQRLGNQFSAADDYPKMAWTTLEKKIQGWILGLRVLVRLMVAEGALAAAVFDGTYAEVAFQEVVSRATNTLTQFGEAIVHAKRAPEKVFGLLDMHENLEAQLLTLFGVLEGTASQNLLQDLVLLDWHMQKEAKNTFLEFEASIAKDSSKHTVTDGTVHPLAAYTLSFLKRLFTYRSAHSILFMGSPVENPPTLAAAKKAVADGPAHEPLTEEGQRSCVRTITSILRTLRANLDSKARSYKDPALSALFTMNNLHYMVKTVENSDALLVLGDDWIEEHKDAVEAAGEEYQRLSWGPLINLVQADTRPAEEVRRAAAQTKEKQAIKDRFTAVNQAIKGLHESQSTWTIPDPLLRTNMKDAISEDFLPFYQDFLARYSSVPFSKNPEKYIKYSVEDIQHMLVQDFFEMREADPHSAMRTAASFRTNSHSVRAK